MRKYPPSQETVLAGFREKLNTSRQANYEVVDRPDETERTRSEIDYILRDPQRSQEVAVEVTSLWRSETAGRQDADWVKWTEKVEQKVGSRLPGIFQVGTPMSAPNVNPNVFADSLVDVMQAMKAELKSLRDKSMEGKVFIVAGVRVLIFFVSSHESRILWARLLSEEDRTGQLEQWKRVLEKKSPKLKAHKDAGRETWLIAYNTFWPVMSPVQVRKMILLTLGTEHDHIDHIGVLLTGNSPDDSLLDIIR